MRKKIYTEKLILWISKKQKKELENLAEKLGRNKSELIREAVLLIIEKYKNTKR